VATRSVIVGVLAALSSRPYTPQAPTPRNSCVIPATVAAGTAARQRLRSSEPCTTATTPTSALQGECAGGLGRTLHSG